MKTFACGHVVPGCSATFRAETEQEILLGVAAHAEKDHGLVELPVELVQQVRGAILTVA